MPAWVVAHKGNRATILCPTGKTKNGIAWEKATVATHHLSSHSARDQATVTPLCQQLASDIYAWGGSITGRDCSLMVRDYYATMFNQVVPRDAIDQGRSPCFDTIDLAGLPWAEKKKKIMAHGVPFQSFVYVPGHSVLYVGNRGTEPVFLQNVWGHKTCANTPEAGRIITGQAFFSDWNSLGFDKNIQNRASCLMTLKRTKTPP